MIPRNVLVTPAEVIRLTPSNTSTLSRARFSFLEVHTWLPTPAEAGGKAQKAIAAKMDLDASAAGGSSNWSSCVSVGGLASLGVAGLLWFLSKAEGERADRLRDIASHERLDGEQLPLHARLPCCSSSSTGAVAH